MIRRTLYQVLDVDASATSGAIASAFRKLAMIHHPDRNPGDNEAAARFRIAHNAFAVLTNPESRREYDRYLAASSVFGNAQRSPDNRTTTRLQVDSGTDALTEALAHLNYVLWEVEDILNSPRGKDPATEATLFEILSFIDREILAPGGHPDYFYEARQMSVPKPDTSRPEWRGTGSPLPDTHGPYAGLSDYFFDLRRRADRFMSGLRLADLERPAGAGGRHMVDLILEAHNRGTAALGALK